MKNIIFIGLAVAILIACENNSKETTAPSPPDATMSAPEIEEEDLPIGYTSATALYKSCAVSSQATDYYFIKEDGKGVHFTISNTEGLSEKEIKTMEMEDDLVGLHIKLEEQMVDTNEGLEGPPGANPSLIDKKFKLIYNEKGKLVEVKLGN